jgi:glycolate oxidase FAD binding subunit
MDPSMADSALLTRLQAAFGLPVEAAPDRIPRVFPDSTQGVADLCGFAHREGLTIRIEGRGSWLPPDAPANFAIATRALSRVAAVTAADLVATAETGIPLVGLNRILQGHGVWLALDPPGSPARSLGSVVATGTAGPLRHGYGPVRDHLLGLTVVTGEGRVVRPGGKVVKNVAGYDLTRLQAGAFGAFGVVTEVHLRLRALPEARLTLRTIGERDLLTRTARDLVEDQIAAATCELTSPERPGAPWSLRVALVGTRETVEAEALRVANRSAVHWTRLDLEPPAAPPDSRVTIRLGVLPDGLDEMIDLLEERLGPGAISAGAGRGMVRWDGAPDPAGLLELRSRLATREIPLTLERAPWELREKVGHFGAYREGVGGLVSRLRDTFDPARVFRVALEPAGDP